MSETRSTTRASPNGMRAQMELLQATTRWRRQADRLEGRLRRAGDAGKDAG